MKYYFIFLTDTVGYHHIFILPLFILSMLFYQAKWRRFSFFLLTFSFWSFFFIRDWQNNRLIGGLPFMRIYNLVFVKAPEPFDDESRNIITYAYTHIKDFDIIYDVFVVDDVFFYLELKIIDCLFFINDFYTMHKTWILIFFYFFSFNLFIKFFKFKP